MRMFCKSYCTFVLVGFTMPYLLDACTPCGKMTVSWEGKKASGNPGTDIIETAD
jgi:hypothetical protein